MQVKEPIYRVRTVNQDTKEATYHFQSKNERDARAFFKSMFPSMMSLKSYQEIQKDTKKYTEVALVKTFTNLPYEFPIWQGFVETKILKMENR